MSGSSTGAFMAMSGSSTGAFMAMSGSSTGALWLCRVPVLCLALLAAGLEQQTVSYTVEVITVSMLKARGEKSQENVRAFLRVGWPELTRSYSQLLAHSPSLQMLKNFHTLCNWSQVRPRSIAGIFQWEWESVPARGVHTHMY